MGGTEGAWRVSPGPVLAALLVSIAPEVAGAQASTDDPDAPVDAERSPLTVDEVLAEIRDTRAALEAARLWIERAELNVELAERLRDAEREQFRAGASDLLSVQIREEKAFDAQVKAVDARLDLFTAVAGLRAALAVGVAAPSVPPVSGDQGGDA